MTATTAPATRRPRQTTRAPKPGVTKTVPAATPKPAPAAKPVPEITRKMQIARDMADAIARTAAPLSADEKQAVANMIHHFPTGRENGRRWWPKNFPTPARSEWK